MLQRKYQLAKLLHLRWFTSPRSQHFCRGLNKASLGVIERAQFVVHLDDASPEDWSTQGHLLMHGDGANRWCDKSFTLVVFANARVGIHVEHSWGDAPTMVCVPPLPPRGA